MSDRKRILEKLKLVSKVTTNSPSPTEEKEVWILYLNILSKYPTDLVLEAIDDYIETSTYSNFPKPAHIILRIKELQLEKENIPNVGDAWAEVLSKVGDLKRTEVPEFSHDIIIQTVQDIGGYRLIMEANDQTSNRSKFYQRYEENINER